MQRIGLSATVNPMRRLLSGDGFVTLRACPRAGAREALATEGAAIVNQGHRRTLDLAPSSRSPLEAVNFGRVWARYARLAELIEAHRPPSSSVNTRRMAGAGCATPR